MKTKRRSDKNRQKVFAQFKHDAFQREVSVVNGVQAVNGFSKLKLFLESLRKKPDEEK